MGEQHILKEKIRIIFKSTKFVWEVNKEYVLLNFLYELLNAIKIIPYMFLMKNAVKIISANTGFVSYIRNIVCLLLLIFVLQFLNTLANRRKGYEKNVLDMQIKDVVFEKNSCIDYFTLSTQEYFMKKNKALEAYRQNCVEKNIVACCFLISQGITLLSVSVTFRQLGFVMLLPIMLSIGVRMLSEIFDRKAYYVRTTKLTDITRKGNYLRKICEGESYAKEIRIFHMEDAFHDKLESICQEKIKVWKAYMKKFRDSSATYEIADVLLQLFLYIFLGYKVLVVSEIQVDEFVYLFTACQQMQDIVGNIALKWMEIYSNTEFLHDFTAYFTEDIEQNGMDKQEQKETFPKEQNTVIEFRNVSFRYPNTQQYALKHINVTLERGKSYLIVGKNGAGKSTFVKLLAGLYRPTEGEIFVNGISIEQMPREEYWKYISALFQDNQTLNFSMKENITSCDVITDQEKLEQVCRDMGIYDKIMSLSKQFETSYSKHFDENGVAFSGGERQKLMLAKTLYKDASLYIFDEPTSGVDAISDEKVYRSIQEHFQDRIIIYITHKLSTGNGCDNIFVFDEGSIAEAGNHKELMKRNGIYSYLYSLQAKMYVEDENEK